MEQELKDELGLKLQSQSNFKNSMVQVFKNEDMTIRYTVNKLTKEDDYSVSFHMEDKKLPLMAIQNLHFALNGMQSNNKNLSYLLKRICLIKGVDESLVKSDCRRKDIVEARRLFCYVARQLTSMNDEGEEAHTYSLPSIGRFINKDHSTVVATIKKLEELLEIYSDVREEVDYIVKCIYGTKI